MSTYLVPDATHQAAVQLRELTTGGELVSGTNGLPVLLVAGTAAIGAVTGTKTNNAAAPGTNNIGALVGIANAAAPTYTEGDLVLLSTDLTGTLRVNASVTPPASVVSTVNSSTTLLTANSVFTGTSESILAYGSVSVEVFTDQASAASGLSIQQSQDGTNWDTVTTASVSASTAFQKTVNTTGQFLRVVYTNGGTNQGVFRLQTIKEVAASPSAGVANQRVNAQSGDFASGAIADGGLVTLGAKADAHNAATDTTAITAMQVLKHISYMLQNPAALVAGSALIGGVEVYDSGGTNKLAIDSSGRLTILSIANALPAGSNLIGGAYLVDSGGTNKATVDGSGRQLVSVGQIGGQSPTLDNTTILATSMRGKGSGTAGDTALLLDSSGHALIRRDSSAVYSLASTTTSGSTQNSGDLTVGPYTEIGIDINTTAQAGTNPTLQLFYERKGADGIYYVLWQSNVLTAATNTLSTSIGAGMAYNQSLGSTGRVRWVVGGTATPTFTMSINVTGK